MSRSKTRKYIDAYLLFTLIIPNKSLLVADFCAAAVLISFGAVLGKASLTQLLVMATFEVVIQSVNEHVGLHYFKVRTQNTLNFMIGSYLLLLIKAYDIGESIYVHVFGAYFGLAVAKSLQERKQIESEKESSVYNSDLFSMIGKVYFLFKF